MALTDKSAIPLGVHDLRVVEGERCFLDRRLALRLGYGRVRFLRRLLERNKADIENRFGPLSHRNSMVHHPQGGSVRETEYWLTKGHALYVCRKSDAKNADDVMEEVIKVFLAVDAGAPIPDTPWTDALFARGAPIIERSDDNVVRITPAQDAFSFDKLAPKHDEDDEIVFPQDRPETPQIAVDTWTDHYEGVSYPVRRIVSQRGRSCFLYVGVGTGRVGNAMMLALWNGDGSELTIYVGAELPSAVASEVVIRNYLKLGKGPYTPIAIATLQYWLAP